MHDTVRVAGLSQGYGRKTIIDGLDLGLRAGVLGLLGPNGAGKTTLLRTLATVVPPKRGDVYICGERVGSERAARRARRNIGYLPQNFGYYPRFSVYDFVRYCGWLREVPAGRLHEATVDAVRAVGLGDHGSARMKSLSGGMIRRAGIAAAIVGNPPLVLLDEPTVGLDPAQRLEFRNLIRSLTGTAVILSTHLVEDVAVTCDDVAVLLKGRFVYRGSPVDLADHAAEDAAGDSPLERGYMSVLSAAGTSAS
ncbi:ABC transporter ATP-binding protein [Planomonospora parontospora subsp. antibiotica]|nr:ABC transporter ATP-binding protein [Planomonospora parontospora subsp. antibiotica]GII13295.1 ABC transporter ATP-binding protein [Planomonospora parontospora subsp. antibiotica]